MDAQTHLAQASLNTADNLRSVAHSRLVQQLSRLSLPEVDRVVEAVAQVVPAGNVPGVILNGLARLPERRLPPNVLRRDVGLLFSGVEAFLDKAMFGALFAGPAAVIWGYQNLLRLAGKDPEDAFPQGTWQFYLDYALRDDTARHANETRGFDMALREHEMRLRPADRLASWVMAAAYALHQYPAMLANEWRERAACTIFREVCAGTPSDVLGAKAYRDWESRRPYARGADAGQLDYPAYRRAAFDRFLSGLLAGAPADLCAQVQDRLEARQASELPAYQEQMSILATLEPDPYGETHAAIPLMEAQVGVIWGEGYWLIPACQPGSDRPPDPEMVRAAAAAILSAPLIGDAALAPLALTRRAELPGLLKKMDPGLKSGLDALRFAPVLINAGPMRAETGNLPLSKMRQAERGIGSHPLTIHDAGEAFVFDQSHIFFDGAWGAALAEILTNEALAWAVYFHSLPDPRRDGQPRHLAFRITAHDRDAIDHAPKVMAEAAAESEAVNLKSILALRKLFKQRNDLIQLTVNDLLVLYRAIHAVRYQLSDGLRTELDGLRIVMKNKPEVSAAITETLEALQNQERANPAILIPIDASLRSPRDRLYPLNFEVPLAELDLISLHQRTLASLEGYQSGSGGERGAAYRDFDRNQRLYLATLAGFGAVLARAKEVALTGEAASVGAIKMLAYLPTPVQRMLEGIPARFDMLNDLIKGREVFSNVGSVAPTSTLTRFITAKDDNEKKTLAWGVMTDAKGVLRMTLRDFRPHVGRLFSVGMEDLADRIAQDYLDAYANGLNGFVRELQKITLSSRETRLAARGEMASSA